MRPSKWHPLQVWDEEHDDLLKAWLDKGASFSEITRELNERFPNRKKAFTRNGVLGRAHRRGYLCMKKPGRLKGEFRKATKRKGVIKLGKNKPVIAKPVPVVFKGALLRSEDERGGGPTGLPQPLREGDPVLDERRKGVIVEVVEEHPLTSIPMIDTERDTCKWPTSSDVRCMEVCGEPATCGAYCDRHGAVAYRTMPTRKRQGRFHKVQDQDRAYEKKRDEADPDLIDVLTIPLFLTNSPELDPCD